MPEASIVGECSLKPQILVSIEGTFFEKDLELILFGLA
jgi:hypothetical protein